MSNLNKLHNKEFRIKLRTGQDADLAKFKKTAVQGELAFTTDTHRLFASRSTSGVAEATLTEVQTLIAPTYLTTSDTYTINSTDRWLIYDGGDVVTLNLPDVSSSSPGRVVTVKNRSNHQITLSAQGSDLIYPVGTGSSGSVSSIGNGGVESLVSGLNGDWNVVQSA